MTSFQKSMPAARAISGACSVTLVEPPIAIATITALRSADGVTMSRGRMPCAVIVSEVVDELVGERRRTPRVVRGRRHHVQRLHADDADEGLHGVVGEHAAAAAEAGAGVHAMRVRSSASGSPATWKALTRSIRSPVSGSVPGWIEPSDMMIAGALCSSSAASVPTGGLSQATTAISPATALADRCTSMVSFTSSRPISE